MNRLRRKARLVTQLGLMLLAGCADSHREFARKGLASVHTRLGVGDSVRGFERVLSKLEPSRDLELEVTHTAIRVHAAQARSLRATLPVSASGSFELQRSDQDFGVRVRLLETLDTPASVDGAHVLFPAGGPARSDMLLAPATDAIEDFVRFATAGPKQLTYRVDVSRVAGLRLVGNSLELVNRTGTALIRVAPPYVLDNTGKTRPARLSVIGCNYDRSGRAVTPPGAASCDVQVAWETEDLVYPIVVDPRWALTNNLAFPRVQHASALVAADALLKTDEQVCVTGGKDENGHPLDSVECFDVQARAWSAPFKMVGPRYDHTATALGDGRILLAGGSDADGPLTSTEVCHPSPGVCVAGPTLGIIPRTLHSATLLDSDGSVVVIGGGSRLPLILKHPQGQDPLPEWTQIDQPMSVGRFGHTAVYAAGRVFVFGGSSSVTLDKPLKSVESFDASENAESWRPDGDMNIERVHHTATHLPPFQSSLHPLSEMILVAGSNDVPELFDLRTRTFKATSVAKRRRTRHAAVQFVAPTGDTSVMLIGGTDGSTPFDNTESYSRTTGTWTMLPLQLNAPRKNHTATVLSDDHTVLIAGGEQISFALEEQTEMVSVAHPGEPCSATRECLSGYCATRDGVCCNEPCNEGCEACTKQNGADQDGVCKTLEQGHACGDAPGACEEASVCDGAIATCPSKLAKADGDPCSDDDSLAACSGGLCVPQGEAGTTGETAGSAGQLEGDLGGDGAGAGAGLGEAGTSSADTRERKPAVRWSCSYAAPGARVTSHSLALTLWLTSLAAILRLRARRRAPAGRAFSPGHSRKGLGLFFAGLLLLASALFSCGAADDRGFASGFAGTNNSAGRGGAAGSGAAGSSAAGSSAAGRGGASGCNEDRSLLVAHWQPLVSVGPGARSLHALASSANGLLLFGGARGHSALADAWSFEGTGGWVARGDGPPARAAHALSNAGSSMLLFGGLGTTGLLADTWQWTSQWTLACTDGSCGDSPPARSGHRMAFDESRNVVVLFGGSNGALLGDTWEWGDGKWLERCGADSSENGGAGGASAESCGVAARQDHALNYDPITRRTLLFGGTDGASDLDDLWALGGDGWSLQTPRGEGPGARAAHTMAFDPSSKRMIVLGGTRDGLALDASVWGLNTASMLWEKAISPGLAPVGRAYGTLAYDPVSAQFVFYGGGTNEALSDVWTLSISLTSGKDLCNCASSCENVCGVNRASWCADRCQQGLLAPVSETDCSGTAAAGAGGDSAGGGEGGTMEGVGSAGLGGDSAAGTGGATTLDPCAELAICCGRLSGSLQGACLQSQAAGPNSCREFLSGGFCYDQQ